MRVRAPLLAHNIRDFWDKWHISLSTWIRDHIYIPLGGSRHGFARTQFNLLAAMVLSGVWHGSGWNFFLWGLFHGLALVLLNISDKAYEKIYKVSAREARDAVYKSSLLGKAVSVFVTVNFVCFCFVFFRAKTFEEALQVFQALFQNYMNVQWLNNPLYLLGLMGQVEADQTWGVGAPLSNTVHVQMKNGWVQFKSSDGLWAVNSLGIIEDDTRHYEACLMCRTPTFEGGRQLLDAIGGTIFEVMGTGKLT